MPRATGMRGLGCARSWGAALAAVFWLAGSACKGGASDSTSDPASTVAPAAEQAPPAEAPTSAPAAQAPPSGDVPAPGEVAEVAAAADERAEAPLLLPTTVLKRKMDCVLEPGHYTFEVGPHRSPRQRFEVTISGGETIDKKLESRV